MSGNPDTSITDVNVALNISGGFNSDLYGSLVYDSSTVELLDRIGIAADNSFEASGAGVLANGEVARTGDPRGGAAGGETKERTTSNEGDISKEF